MPKMIRELNTQPELGFLHAEMWFGRTTMMMQYWSTIDHLIAYATNRVQHHLPAWQAFNRASRDNHAVGIWHETYIIQAGQYENIYVDMPRFGLGRVGTLSEVTGGQHRAQDRFKRP